MVMDRPQARPPSILREGLLAFNSDLRKTISLQAREGCYGL
jgi:hypothetical protein